MVRLQNSAGSFSTRTSKPSVRNASVITCVSSLQSAPVKRHFAIRQRREDECAVRDALRARHGDLRAHGLRERDDFDEIG
jgi:hypothetical protein